MNLRPSQAPPATSAPWFLVEFLFVFIAAFCVFCLLFGGVFFVFGGFVLFLFKQYLAFALIVTVPALVLGFFAALLAAFPAGWPPPIGDLGLRSDEGEVSE